MATPDDIATVRKNVAEPTQTNWTDAVLGTFIDQFGVAGASARIWEQKAAEAAELVNVTEAGASHSFSNLHKQALEMSAYFADQQAIIDFPVTDGTRTRVRQIERS